MVRSYDEMKRKLENELNGVNAKIEGWEKVVIKKKKDGSEYKRMTKACVENAYFEGNSWRPQQKELSISTYTEGLGYKNDIITVSIYSNESFKTLAPGEIRVMIQRKVKELKEERDSIQEAIKVSKEYYDNLYNAIFEVRKIYEKSQGYGRLYNALREAASNYYF